MQTDFSAPLTSAEQVLEKYANMVLQTAYSMVKNRHDAEDIAQEVFISLMRAKPEFANAEHQKAWLLRATINRCKSFFRSAWQQKTQGLPEELSDVAFTPQENIVVEAVNQLPQKYREVIYLYYIEGYAAKEIAQILALPQNTVLSHMSRARKLLKTALKGDFDDAFS